MAASQNVVKAATGGWLALLAGVASVVACLAFVPLVSRIGSRQTADSDPQTGDSK